MNLLPTGTATSWRRLESEQDHETQTYTYVHTGRPGVSQGQQFLVEELRQDGAASTLGAALSMVEQAELYRAWLYVDENTGEETVTEDKDEDLGELTYALIAKVPFDD